MSLKNYRNSVDWYKRTREKLIADYGKDADLIADLIAATSPRTPIAINIELAEEVYKKYCLFEDYQNVKGLLPNHRANIEKALLRKPLAGLKVQAFAENLKGNLNAITVDTITCLYFKYERIRIDKKLRKSAYDTICKKIKRNAKRHRLKPAEYQAIIWVKARGVKAGSLSMFDKGIAE